MFFIVTKTLVRKILMADEIPSLMETALIFFDFLEYFLGVLLPIRYTGSEVFLTTVVLAED